ncbi:Glyoxalase/Bleomycin resistance protein/Dioxygenase superfamily protein [Lysinibacillus sp. AC-3]|nr:MULTISPECIES: VOC family protein [unclassified Lysinibacillus]SKB66262.1 Glyoxalase/Bleomycin resistance protein/Dioxygenase superfamily protein [Lysinibacillus sp. AC-3]
MAENKLLRMDNVGIVVESLDDAIAFFEEIGLNLEGRATVEGEWAGRVTGLGSQCVEIAMMATPDGHSRLELSQFLSPPTISDHRTAPVNALGYLRVMFAVEDIDEMVSRLTKHGEAFTIFEENSYTIKGAFVGFKRLYCHNYEFLFGYCTKNYTTLFYTVRKCGRCYVFFKQQNCHYLFNESSQ